MAKTAGAAWRTYLDQYNISGYSNSSDLAIAQETPVVTCFSDGGPRRLVGNYDIQHNDLGFFDGTTGAFDTMLAALEREATPADHYLTKCPAGSAENSLAYDSAVRLTGKPLSAAMAGAVLLNFSSAGSHGVSRGLVLASMTSTGAESRTGRNQGITTTPALYRVIFRLLAFTGTDITIKIQGSSDNAGADPYGDIAGLTSGALTAVGVVMASTTATTEAWKRCVTTTSAGYSSALILVTAGTVVGT